jgi:hypothetical protein
MAVSWLIALLGIGLVTILVVALLVFGVFLTLNSGNRKSDGDK